MIRCQHCNALNTLDRVLCISCGKALDFNNPVHLELDETTQKDSNKKSPAVKVRLAKDDFFGRILSSLGILTFFFCIFLMFYSGHISEKEISRSAVETLNKKLNSTEAYLELDENEINLYLERLIHPFSSEIESAYSGFLSFRRLFIRMESQTLSLHIVFSVFNRPIYVTFNGPIKIENGQLRLSVFKSYLGRLRFPLALCRLFTQKLNHIAEIHKFLTPPKQFSKANINRNTLTLYQSFAPTASSETQQKNDQDLNLPDDILLVQAADSFLSRGKKEKRNENYLICNNFSN